MSAPRRRPGPGGPGMAGEKAKDFKGTVGKLLTYMGVYKIALLFVAIFSIVSTVLSIQGPKILGGATDELFNGLVAKIQGTGGIDYDALAAILIKLVVIYAVSALLSLLMGFIMTHITQRITYRMRKELNEKINRLPMQFFDRQQHGEVLSIITNDVDMLSMNLNQSIIQLITSITTILGVLWMMFSIDWVLTIVALLILPISVGFVSIVVKKSQRFFRAQQEHLGHVNGHIEETFGGINVIQAFNKEDEVTEMFERENRLLCESAWKSQFLSGLMQPIMQFIGNLGYVVVCVLGAALAIDGQITFGVITAFIMYVRLFTSPLSTLAQGTTQMQTAAAAGDRVFDFLQEEELSDESYKTEKLTEVHGEVEFDHVRFSYPDNPDKIIIKDFSAHIKPGQKVAIVGPTGAGKTTMVNLLMRFFDLVGGDIRIDGISTSDLTRENIHELFGMVLQDTWLFDGTVRENLVYNKTGVTDEELEKACRACGIYHFIETLPNGFDTVLGENVVISAGQKQLFTIARAMVQNSPMLILDEATSSVDTRTELITQKAMDTLTAHRTSFVIAHRLSTIKNADLILVMRDGDIVEQGNHTTLLAQGGFYADLYNSQFEKAG